jgi:hypothetical protein
LVAPPRRAGSGDRAAIRWRSGERGTVFDQKTGKSYAVQGTIDKNTQCPRGHGN